MKKKKQIIGISVVALLVVIGVVFLGKTENFNFIKNKIQETSNSAKEKNDSKQEEDIQLTETEKVHEQILSGCTQEFIGNYPMDENFLNWFHASYGDDVIGKIAEAVESKNMNKELWYHLTGSSIHVLWLQYCNETGFQVELIENVYYKECASKEEIVLDFTGDINLAEGWSTTRFMDQQENGIFDCISVDLMSELQGADILLVNNEFTYSTEGYPLPGKAYTFRANPSRVEVLQQMGTDIVSLANNHVYDYGKEALIDTLETLENAKIPYVGAGRNLDEAKKIVYFVANGKKIAIVSATQIERSYNYTKEATEYTPGVLKTLNSDKFVEVIKEAESNSDYVIAYPHWGTEGTNTYGSDQKELAMDFIAAGADVIIGGHTHCLQGITYIEDVPIIYSLGNFWFNGNTIETGIAQVRIQKNGEIKFRFLPCMQSGTRTKLLTEGEQKEEVLDFMRSLSEKVEIDENGYVTNLAK